MAAQLPAVHSGRAAKAPPWARTARSSSSSSATGGPPLQHQSKRRKCSQLRSLPTQAPLSSSISLQDASPLQAAGAGDDQPGPSGRGQAAAAGSPDGTFWYYAYGANMAWSTLSRREVKVLSRDPAVVKDPRVKLVFRHQGGYATLERTDVPAAFQPYDQRVHGVLFKVSKEDFARLQKREGGYTVQEIEVETYDGRLVTAFAFVSSPLFMLPKEVTPTEAYVAVLRDGARDNYLDPLYQAFLSGIKTVPSAGLGPEYYNTPSKFVAWAFLFIVGCIVVTFFSQRGGP